TEVTDRIAHIAWPLYTWRAIPGSAAATQGAKPYAWNAGKRALEDALVRRGRSGSVTRGLLTGQYRVAYAIDGEPSVTIIIPTKDRLDLLEPCVRSIQARSTYSNYRLLIVDNGSVEHETRRFLDDLE